MLVLSRRQGERIVIDGDIEVVVLASRGDRVRLGIIAPDNVPVHREEVARQIHANQPGRARAGLRRNRYRSHTKAS